MLELPQKPEHINNLEFVRILTPYIFTCCIISGKSILDVGCGFGHGTRLFVTYGAEQVVAFDLDKTKVRQLLQLQSNAQNFNALVMDAQRIGFKDQRFQVVTCFEVIEHVPKPDTILSELRQILRIDGVLLMTTPNRSIRLLPLQRPWNPEHLREYSLRGLKEDLKKYFPFCKLLGIYADPEPYEFYRKLWQQSFLHVYFGWALRIMRSLTPAPVRAWIKSQVGRNNSECSIGSTTDLINIDVPAPDPKNWPFYVSDVKDNCLNFLAVCGFDDQIVKRTTSEITRSAFRLSQL